MQNPYRSYNHQDYVRYTIPQCGMNRPSLLDHFLSDPRTSSLSLSNPKKLHIAIVVKRGKILASASNKVASRSNGAATRGSQNYIHAEKNLLRVLGDNSKLKGADVYVMRIASYNGSLEFRYSQPCPECTVLLEKCMREYGLRNVYFTK